jgi:hypothetical protein
LWKRLRDDARFKFVPHTIPDAIRKQDRDEKGWLPFLANFVALDTKTPLLADDRACQMFTLNQMEEVACAAFGSDALTLALMRNGTLDSGRAAAAIRQLMAWRYRFVAPPPELLKTLSDQYREHPPGRALRDVAEYAQDCMRDPGLFAGLEKTEMRESMAMRLYLTWLSLVPEFLVMVWADESYTAESATQLTQWCCDELLPACPPVAGWPVITRVAQSTTKFVLSHALLKAANHPGEPRMAECMKAMQQALRLSNDEYIRTVTEILHAMPAT